MRSARSHAPGSTEILSAVNATQALNRELLAAGLVDRIQVTVFPVVSGQTGSAPVFAGAPDLDLRLVSHQVFDGQIAEFTYEPCRRI